MSPIIAYCGLNCSECPAYVATQANDEQKLKELVGEWSTDDYQVTLAEMYCDGCIEVGGRVFKWCRECPIRLCCIERGYANCAHCPDLPCDKLTQAPPGTVERLQEMRAALNP